MLRAGGSLPISFSDGFLILAPGTTPTTMYDGAADAWTTFQDVPVGATGLSSTLRLHHHQHDAAARQHPGALGLG